MADTGAGDSSPPSNPASPSQEDSQQTQPKDGKKQPRLAFEHEELRVMVEGLVRHEELLFRDRRATPRDKNRVWDRIAQQVTAVGPCPRTREDLKKRWQDMKVRTRRKVKNHEKAVKATGGGTVPDLVLKPWEEGCVSIMDEVALHGVGEADYGTPRARDEPSKSNDPMEPT